ncbi:60S ribosomal protein L22 [Candidatus Bathyarchaeota archaeon]|nr:60S ribosomal protein L22 [Candidatus Bathyarchaeota archaeon]MCK4482699.1 60S ribosomal protein L22 [Candidatus Bathyarchaeota archaeon]
MSEMRVDISELKSEGSDLIKELAEFLKEKMKTEVETATNEITIKGEGKAISKKYLRVLLRKFLHRNELKDYFRVIGEKENVLSVRERKISE